MCYWKGFKLLANYFSAFLTATKTNTKLFQRAKFTATVDNFDFNVTFHLQVILMMGQ